MNIAGPAVAFFFAVAPTSDNAITVDYQTHVLMRGIYRLDIHKPVKLSLLIVDRGEHMSPKTTALVFSADEPPLIEHHKAIQVYVWPDGKTAAQVLGQVLARRPQEPYLRARVREERQ